MFENCMDEDILKIFNSIKVWRVILIIRVCIARMLSISCHFSRLPLPFPFGEALYKLSSTITAVWNVDNHPLKRQNCLLHRQIPQWSLVPPSIHSPQLQNNG